MIKIIKAYLKAAREVREMNAEYKRQNVEKKKKKIELRRKIEQS